MSSNPPATNPEGSPGRGKWWRDPTLQGLAFLLLAPIIGIVASSLDGQDGLLGLAAWAIHWSLLSVFSSRVCFHYRRSRAEVPAGSPKEPVYPCTFLLKERHFWGMVTLAVMSVGAALVSWGRLVMEVCHPARS